MQNTKRYLLLLIGLFLVSRLIFYSIGIRFDIKPLLWFHQFIDPILLKKDLLQSTYYQHTQPPLFNLMLGSVLKIARNYEILAFQIFYAVLGLVLSSSLFLLMRRFEVSPKLAFALTTIFILSPASILYENWLLHTYVVAALLIAAAYFLHRFFSSRKFADGFLFFLLLAICALTRSTYHLLWFLVILLFVVNVGKAFTRTILLAASFPLALILSLFVKNWFLWGEMTNSTWMGPGLYKVASTSVSNDEVVRLVRMQKLSEVSLYHPFSWLAAYPPDFRKSPQTEVPVLDQKIRSTGFNNYNQLAYQQISKHYLRDAVYLITHYPGSYLKGVIKCYAIYFTSATDNYFLKVNRDRILRYNRFFDLIFFGKFGQDGQIAWFLLAGIPLLVLFSILHLIRHKQDWNEALKVTYLFMIFNVLYVTIIANALEIGENNRYRFEIDPIYVAMLGVALNQWFRRAAN